MSSRNGRLVRAWEGDGICAFVPNRLPAKVDFLGDIRDESEKAMFCLGKLSAIIPNLPNPELLTEPFMRREAVLSSKIEGTKTGVGQLYLFETEEKSGNKRQDDDLGDAREVLNYVMALQHGLEQLREIPVCNRLMRDMHRILMDRVADDRGLHKSPGEFRNQQVYIGKDSDIRNARYVPPPSTEVPALMADLEQYINDCQKELPTLVKIALVHYQFEAIHPFSDGNGRLGRVLISLLLSSLNIIDQPLLYLSAFFERNQNEYVQNLWHVSRYGAWYKWVKFFLQGVIEESNDVIARAKRLMLLRESYRQSLQASRHGSSSLGLIDFLFHWPIVSVPDVAKKLDMSYPGAQKIVEKLAGSDILEEVTGRRRNRLYIAKEIIKILEEPVVLQ
jgi:Fic family protein